MAAIVKHQDNGKYVASAKNQNGTQIQESGNSWAEALEKLLIKAGVYKPKKK